MCASRGIESFSAYRDAYYLKWALVLARSHRAAQPLRRFGPRAPLVAPGSDTRSGTLGAGRSPGSPGSVCACVVPRKQGATAGIGCRASVWGCRCCSSPARSHGLSARLECARTLRLCADGAGHHQRHLRHRRGTPVCLPRHWSPPTATRWKFRAMLRGDRAAQAKRRLLAGRQDRSEARMLSSRVWLPVRGPVGGSAYEQLTGRPYGRRRAIQVLFDPVVSVGTAQLR